MDGLSVLPLAVTMMAGPQIISAIVLTTAPRPVRVSLGFLAGIALATTAGVAVMLGVAALLGSAVDLGSSGDKGSTGQIVQYVLVALLLALAVRNWHGRHTSEPPKWLGSLMSAGPRRAFGIGLLLIPLMPADLMILFTVGVHLEQHGASFAEALPFIGLTVLVAALPLLVVLVFHRWARSAMPKVRDWTNSHSWLVNIAVCLLFIVLILG